MRRNAAPFLWLTIVAIGAALFVGISMTAFAAAPPAEPPSVSPAVEKLLNAASLLIYFGDESTQYDAALVLYQRASQRAQASSDKAGLIAAREGLITVRNCKAAERKGNTAAQHDIVAGRLVLKFYGLPRDFDSLTRDTLALVYGIGMPSVAGCMVTPAFRAEIEGYNRVSRPAIERRIGLGGLRAVENDAAKALKGNPAALQQWETALQSNRLNERERMRLQWLTANILIAGSHRLEGADQLRSLLTTTSSLPPIGQAIIQCCLGEILWTQPEHQEEARTLLSSALSLLPPEKTANATLSAAEGAEAVVLRARIHALLSSPK